MEILEHIALLQRVTGAIKSDIENRNSDKALSKLEILEGELGVFRDIYLPKEEVNNEIPSVSSTPEEIIDTEGEVIK